MGTGNLDVCTRCGEGGPEPREAEDTEQLGRGLLLVQGLADRWGHRPRTVGKTVYVEWDLIAAPVLLVDAKERREWR